MMKGNLWPKKENQEIWTIAMGATGEQKDMRWDKTMTSNSELHDSNIMINQGKFWKP